MQIKSIPAPRGFRALAPLVFSILLSIGLSTVEAQINDITLLTNDALGSSSFLTGTNWSDGNVPFSGDGVFTNAYFTSTNTLRTPGGSGAYIFGGDSLEVDTNGGVLAIKGYGLITVSNLVLNGGKVSNAGTGGIPDEALLAGDIYLETNAVTVTSVLDGGGSNAFLNIMAPITGPGGLAISDYGTVIFSASNSYLGNTTLATNSILKMGATNAIPNGTGFGTFTMNPSTAISAVLDLNGYDTTVNDLNSGGSTAVPAQVINSGPAGQTNTLTVNIAVGGKTWKGWINDSNAAGGKLALTVTGSPSIATAWTVASNLTYAGDTTVNSGRLSMGSSTVLPWGPGKGNIIVNGTGILDLQGRSPQMNGLSGNGTVDNYAGNGPGAGGHSTLNVGSNDVTSTFSGVIQNQYYYPFVPANDYIQIGKYGAGTLTLTGTNTYNGNVSVNAGILRITCQNGDGMTGGGLGLGSETTPPTKIISITSSTGDAGIHFMAASTPITVDSTLSWQTAGTNGAIVNEAGNNTINGTISLRTGGATTIRVDGDTLTLNGNINIVSNTTSRTLTLSGVTNGFVYGAISDGSSTAVPNTNLLSLTKAGGGTWMLDNTNTYSGATVVNGGTLALAAAGSISNTPAITLQSNATFDVSAVSGGWALGASQTLSGVGMINGSATINGTLSPGSSPLGALTFASTAALAGTAKTVIGLNRASTPNADSVAAASLVRNGSLTVTNLGTALQGGDTFTIFTGTMSGSFTATNLPALSSTNLYWDTSRLGTGILAVGGSSAAPQPHLTSVTLNGSQLVITGTNGVQGETYTVLSTTNLPTPYSAWTPLFTNTFSGANFSVTNTVNPTAAQVYYVIRIP